MSTPAPVEYSLYTWKCGGLEDTDGPSGCRRHGCQTETVVNLLFMAVFASLGGFTWVACAGKHRRMDARLDRRYSVFSVLFS